MSKAQRRVQLLETAAAVVRAEGVEALTLARLAEQAGVTKPIAYEHFGTRAGLLIALYQHFDARQTEAVAAALKASARRLNDIALLLATAYVDCTLQAGPEFGAISDALSASEEMDDFRQVLRDGYVDQFLAAFGAHITASPSQARLTMSGLLGAADVLARSAAGGRCTRQAAISTLVDLMVRALA